MDLSGLKSADAIDAKDVIAARFRIVWDHLGWFPPQVVPVLFPRSWNHSYARWSLRVSVRQLFEYATGCIFLPDEGVSAL